MKVQFLSKRLGLIALWRESMSRRNPSRRSASSPKVEVKTLLFSPHFSPRKGLYSSSQHLKPLPLVTIYITCRNRKKLALARSQVSYNAASYITHSAIADQDSLQVTRTFSAHCRVHCRVEDFNINFANHDAKLV